ncbi:MAG: DUF4321 domain-containing protein [Nitrospirota bacterium]
MAVPKKTEWLLIFFIILGGLLGGILAEMLKVYAPAGILHDIFLIGISIGITPPLTIDLYMLTFTIGFNLNVNFFTLLGIILGIYVYRLS